MESNERVYIVKSLEKALMILDCFSYQNREMTLTELVKLTGIHVSTAKRLVSHLTHRGYLQKEPGTKRYRLGLRLFEMGGIVFSSFSLRKASSYSMSRLQSETGATVLMGAIMEDQLIYVDKREGLGPIRVLSDVGQKRPPHYGMMGMMLMAHLNSEEKERILRKYPLEAHTPLSITDSDAFSIRLEEIRVQGYVIERGEAVEGTIGISAPIRDYRRKVIAALGISLVAVNSDLEGRMQWYVDMVIKACDDISSNLGYLRI